MTIITIHYQITNDNDINFTGTLQRYHLFKSQHNKNDSTINNSITIQQHLFNNTLLTTSTQRSASAAAIRQ